MNRLSNAVVYDVESLTERGKWYRVVLAENDEFSSCNCPAFRFGNRNPCKHLQEARFHNTEPLGGTSGQTLEELADLFARALTWVDNDPARAKGLVLAYLAGRDGKSL